jgi:D-alanine--poly(phosphoribitol) ligase subunit 2
MREKLLALVLKTINEFNAAYQQKIPLEKREETPLYGKEGVLDSLGLVSLIVMIEQEIEDDLDVSLILADERAMSQKTSPFLNVCLLVDYINRLMDEELSVWTDQSL